MPAGDFFPKPLRLGSDIGRKKSAGDLKSLSPVPEGPLPPVPSVPSQHRRDISTDSFVSAPAAIDPSTERRPSYASSTSGVPQSQTFRLLPPMAALPTPVSWRTPTIVPNGEDDLGGPASIIYQHQNKETHTRRLQAELRGRPLNESVYGRAIISLLMLPWVIAPSGLAVTTLPPNSDPTYVSDVASYINLLMCGSEAFAAPYAGILGVQRIQMLNRFFVQAGLSPIVPGTRPTPWPPLGARQPPDFIQDGFMRPMRSPQSDESHAER